VVSDELTANGEVSEVKHECCSPKIIKYIDELPQGDNYLGQKSRERVEALELSEIDSTENGTTGRRIARMG